MQCLSAPTRKEIDRAHARGVWLDIGIPSVRNLRYISKRRVLIWALLGLSSLPLHLFYNSMVFSSIASHDYYAFSVSQSFTDDTDCLNCDKIADFSYRQIIQSMHQKVRNGELDRLEAADCISQYSTMIQSFRRNLLLVAANDKFPAKSDFPPFNDTNVYYASEFDSEYATSSSQSIDAYAWICAAEKIDYSLYRGSCANVANQIKADAKNCKLSSRYEYQTKTYDNRTFTLGRIYKYPVEYCLSEKAPPMCKLHILLPIGYLVTFLNLFKAVLILYTVFYVKDNPLMTMGDAVASFMEDRDPTTKDLCLLTMHDLKQHRDFFPAGPREWSGQKYRWKDVTSRTRRTVTLIMFVIAIGTVSGLLDMGIRALRDNSFSVSLPDLARMGFGAIDPRTIIVWDISSTMSNILIANIAQPLLSFLYFSYNGLFTCMLLGFEWSRYAYKRRGLRVSRARAGAQRSTYFLQLPYRFSLPLMVLSGVLHWLVSQSIFLVAIDLYYPSGESRDVDTMNGSATGGFKSCGYSPIAIVSVVVLAAIMVIAAIGFGYVPYKPGMPLAGSCSAAISAACHNEEWDEVDGAVAARERLKWGVVGVGPDGVGHCALSTKGVTFPEKGKMYA